MTAEPILYDVSDHVATIVLNRPDQRNSLTAPMVSLWIEAIEEARLDDEVRVVVVRGAGDRAFCVGADLGSGAIEIDAASPAMARNSLRYTIHALMRELQLLDKPLIAGVNGAAAGAGMDIASAADIRIGSANARLSMAYVKIGVVPGDGGAYYLPRIIGLQRALHLAWTGEVLDARTALEWGYFLSIHEPEEFADSLRAYAHRLAAGPTLAQQMTKRLVYQCLDATEQHALELASSAMAMVLTTEDAKEGPRAFAERRSPDFRGR